MHALTIIRAAAQTVVDECVSIERQCCRRGERIIIAVKHAPHATYMISMLNEIDAAVKRDIDKKRYRCITR